MTVKILINQQEILAQDGDTVLQAANRQGISIPTLCYHKDLSPVGSCRLCMVEIEKWRGQVAACTTSVTEGMVILTETPSIIKSRKMVLELLLENYVDAAHDHDQHVNEFQHWINYYGVSLPGGRKPQARFPVDSDPNPFLWVDWNKCILCTRCVRACSEIQGRMVWGVGYRGYQARIVAGADTPLLEARCESCGACVAYCPTGALDNKMSINAGVPDRLVTTSCTYCGVGCQFDLNIEHEKVVRVTSNPNAPVNGMNLCVKGRYGYDFIHHPDRVVRPRVRKYLLDGVPRGTDRGDWVEVDWDIALDLTANRLRQIRDQHGSDSIGVLTSAKCLNEENYLMNKFARQALGTNNIDHCARL